MQCIYTSQSVNVRQDKEFILYTSKQIQPMLKVNVKEDSVCAWRVSEKRCLTELQVSGLGHTHMVLCCSIYNRQIINSVRSSVNKIGITLWVCNFTPSQTLWLVPFSQGSDSSVLCIPKAVYFRENSQVLQAFPFLQR